MSFVDGLEGSVCVDDSSIEYCPGAATPDCTFGVPHCDGDALVRSWESTSSVASCGGERVSCPNGCQAGSADGDGGTSAASCK